MYDKGILFKGYVPTKNKQCLVKFKGKDASELHTIEQVQTLPEFAGILNDDIILIDIDNSDEAELLMDIVEEKQLNCRVYQTTRGKHFLFRNNGIEKNGTNKKLACGLTADIKLGSRNSYSVLKFNNEDRFIEWDIEPDEDYQEIPKWLIPINSSFDFLDMEVGDGRNQALFNYILTLQSNDFSVEEARETIRLINKHVLKVPLRDTELEVVLRDDAFKKPIFFKGTTFLFDKFATYIKNNNHIIRINNQLHIYEDGTYYSDTEKIEAAMVRNISNLNRAKRTEVLSYLRLICKNEKVSDANLIAFNNGIYDIETSSFMNFSPNYIITNKIPWDYNPGAYSKLVDNTLNKIACQDKQIRMLLEEAIGYCMYRRNELGKAFILIGDRSNGKSTFLDMVKTMLGDENIASLDLGELGERFKTAELFGKLANIGDDIGDEFIANASVFKKLVTGERLSVEKKGQDPFEFNNYSKMLFSANNIPRIGKGRDTGAILRRLTIIPFDARFDPDDPDYTPNIKYKLRDVECVEYMVLLGLEGLKRVLKNKAYTKSEKVEQELEDYEVSNNPIAGFIQENEADEFENETTKDVYKRYQVYCAENSYMPLAHNEFSKQLKRYTDLDTKRKTIDGVKYTIYVRKN
jgi:putative DNA primase/helicase